MNDRVKYLALGGLRGLRSAIPSEVTIAGHKLVSAARYINGQPNTVVTRAQLRHLIEERLIWMVTSRQIDSFEVVVFPDASAKVYVKTCSWPVHKFMLTLVIRDGGADITCKRVNADEHQDQNH